MQDSNLTICIFPEEIITEILSRLPVKSLLKFRSVSKSWLALISSPEFIKTHLSLSANNNKEETHHVLMWDLAEWKFTQCPITSLFDDSVTVPLDLDDPIENANKEISILGSCNGLIFLADYSEYSLLWNPTTRKHKNLPDFRPRLEESYPIYGFGYDELHDDYKVVGIFCYYFYSGSDDVEVKVYSLKRDSWTSVDYCGDILDAPGSSQKMKLNHTGLFVNGKLHWNTINVGPIERAGRNIISFDLANEKWETMEKPSYGVGETDLYVGNVGSDLCVFSVCKGYHLGAWVMKEYGVQESWIKMFTIRDPVSQNLYPPFFMSNKGEILVLRRNTFMIDNSEVDSFRGTTFMIYNSEDHSFRYPDVINCDSYYDAEFYIESLVCPFSTEGTQNAGKEMPKGLRSKQSSNK